MSKYPVVAYTRIVCLNIVVLLALLSLPVPGFSSASTADCMMCHSARSLKRTKGGDSGSLYIDLKAFNASVHGQQACVDCHADLASQPLKHKADLAPAQCAECHSQTDTHVDAIHEAMKKDKDRPNCQDCHGSHYMTKTTDPSSPVLPERSEVLCTQCHSNGKDFTSLLHSVHGATVEDGKGRVAECTECHAAHTGVTAISPNACAECHSDEHRAYLTSSHGTAWKDGSTDVPTCVKCHGGHDILVADDPRSAVFRSKIADDCGECHDDTKLMAKYDLPGDSLETYRDSFHGIALEHGHLDSATCTDCHQSHDVLPSSDPRSATHEANLPETCGECHEQTNENWAKGEMHVDISHEDKDVLYWVSNGFKWLTIGTMTALVGHIMLDLFAQARGWRRRSNRRTRR